MDHYLRFEDGLPTKLTQPIKPSRPPQDVIENDDPNRPPKVGPRPPDLVSSPSRSDSPDPGHHAGSPPQREASLPSSPPPVSFDQLLAIRWILQTPLGLLYSTPQFYSANSEWVWSRSISLPVIGTDSTARNN